MDEMPVTGGAVLSGWSCRGPHQLVPKKYDQLSPGVAQRRDNGAESGSYQRNSENSGCQATRQYPAYPVTVFCRCSKRILVYTHGPRTNFKKVDACFWRSATWSFNNIPHRHILNAFEIESILHTYLGFDNSWKRSHYTSLDSPSFMGT
jgi:hypothetical protein